MSPLNRKRTIYFHIFYETKKWHLKDRRLSNVEKCLNHPILIVCIESSTTTTSIAVEAAASTIVVVV